MVSLLGTPKPAVDRVVRAIWSEGGTPILESETIEPSVWKSGLPTPVQGLFPNSTALILLARFTKGDIQMQGEAVKHLQERNLAKLKNITIELMKLDGRVLRTIENVNLLEEGIEKVKEPTIGEMLSELESKSEVMADTVTNVCSMGKSKKGKVNPTKPSLALEKQKAKKKEKSEMEVSKEKPKPAPKSGLGPKKKIASAAQPTTRSSPRDLPPKFPTQNPRINPATGVPYTTVAEKRAIRELLKGRGKRQDVPEEDSSSSEGMEALTGIKPLTSSEELEEEIKTLVKKRRTSKDLVAK